MAKRRRKSGENKSQKDDQGLDFDSMMPYIKKYGPMLLIIIPIFFSILFRIQPAYLPIADEWAEDTVQNYYMNMAQQQVAQQYPNLPEEQKKQFAQEQFQEFLTQNEDQYKKQVADTAAGFRARMQDDSGQTYLLAIDPWVWLGYAENYVENGHMGDTLKEGESWYTLRNGREGQSVGSRLFSRIEVWIYYVMNLFGDYSMMTAAFYLPVILLTLASAAMFIVGKQVGGYGFATIASTIFAIHSGLLGRTAAGFSDTDNIIAFGEAFTVMFVFLCLNSENIKRKLIYGTLAGLSLAFYSMNHSSWWHMLHFIGGAFAITFVYQLIMNKKELLKDYRKVFSMEKTRNLLISGFTFFFSGWLFTILMRVWFNGFSWENIFGFVTQPVVKALSFIQSKSVGVSSVWPNVLTTVAERNTIPLSKVIAQIGGTLAFALSVVGVLYLFYKGKKDHKYIFLGSFLALWYIGAIYASTDSIRFVAFLVPAFGLGIAAFTESLEKGVTKLSRSINISTMFAKPLVYLAVFVVILLPLFSSAAATAKQEVPSMNDAWYESLTGIKDATEDAIITSWWDFGHWFVTIADRRVTFDGGDQGERIHWVGKTLLTENETLSVGTLRMLNCGQEKPPHILEKYLDNDTVEAVSILDEIMVLETEDARDYLEDYGFSDDAVREVLNYTHCAEPGKELIPQFYITSDDMVGKAGVWGHFGSWNFTKASMYNKVNKKKQAEGVQILQDEFGFDENSAVQMYFEIRSADADQWISGWPGYFEMSNCQGDGDIVTCGNGLQVDLSTMDASIQTQQGKMQPETLTYATAEDVVEKEFDSNSGFAAALIPSGDGYQSIFMDPLQSSSVFTRLYFYEGHGMECFDKFSYKQSFTGNEIYIWEVDWECSSKNIVYGEDEEIHAKHILVSTDNRTEEEALELAQNISERINETNFEDLARDYSEGPSASNGGDLGSFGKGQMVPAFDDVAFDLEIDEVSEPVLTEFGYHIIKRIE